MSNTESNNARKCCCLRENSCVISDDDSCEDTDDDYFTFSDDESSSDDEGLDLVQTCFICYYKKQKSVTLVSFISDIECYRKNLKPQSKKDKEFINTLWGQIRVHVFDCGFMPLRVYYDAFYKKLVEIDKVTDKVTDIQNNLLVRDIKTLTGVGFSNLKNTRFASNNNTNNKTAQKINSTKVNQTNNLDTNTIKKTVVSSKTVFKEIQKINNTKVNATDKSNSDTINKKADKSSKTLSKEIQKINSTKINATNNLNINNTEKALVLFKAVSNDTPKISSAKVVISNLITNTINNETVNSLKTVSKENQELPLENTVNKTDVPIDYTESGKQNTTARFKEVDSTVKSDTESNSTKSQIIEVPENNLNINTINNETFTPSETVTKKDQNLSLEIKVVNNEDLQIDNSESDKQKTIAVLKPVDITEESNSKSDNVSEIVKVIENNSNTNSMGNKSVTPKTDIKIDEKISAEDSIENKTDLKIDNSESDKPKTTAAFEIVNNTEKSDLKSDNDTKIVKVTENNLNTNIIDNKTVTPKIVPKKGQKTTVALLEIVDTLKSVSKSNSDKSKINEVDENNLNSNTNSNKIEISSKTVSKKDKKKSLKDSTVNKIDLQIKNTESDKQKTAALKKVDDTEKSDIKSDNTQTKIVKVSEDNLNTNTTINETVTVSKTISNKDTNLSLEGSTVNKTDLQIDNTESDKPKTTAALKKVDDTGKSDSKSDNNQIKTVQISENNLNANTNNDKTVTPKTVSKKDKKLSLKISTGNKTDLPIDNTESNKQKTIVASKEVDDTVKSDNKSEISTKEQKIPIDNNTANKTDLKIDSTHKQKKTTAALLEVVGTLRSVSKLNCNESKINKEPENNLNTNNINNQTVSLTVTDSEKEQKVPLANSTVKKTDLQIDSSKSNKQKTTAALLEVVSTLKSVSNSNINQSKINKASENSENTKSCENISELTKKKNLTTNTEQEDLILFEEYTSKKKLKKQKQKEKKLENQKISSANNTPSENQVKKSLTKASELKDQKSMDPSENMSSDEEDLKGLLDPDAIPEFYKEAFKRCKKYVKTAPKKKSPNRIIRTGGDSESEDDDFKINKRKPREPKKKILQTNLAKSEQFGIKGVDMILDNKYTSAIHCLTKAISFNNTDCRHYLNRSYSYLRVECPKEALADAQYVIQNSKNIAYLFIANLRAGQAKISLKRYPQAEAHLKEALHLYPESPHAKREYMRVRIMRIVENNFNERVAINALDLYPSASDAITHLIDSNTPQHEYELEFFNFNDDYDDQVYESDQDISITEILNFKLNYKHNEIKVNQVAEPLFNWLNAKAKVLETQKTTAVKKQQVVSNAVWVGSLNKYITDPMIKKVFKAYGPIISIHRPEGQNYCFINFERSEDVTKLLRSLINGKLSAYNVDLVVKQGVRK